MRVWSQTLLPLKSKNMSESSTRRDEPDELEDDDCSSYTLKLLSMTHEERQAEKQVRIDKKSSSSFSFEWKKRALFRTILTRPTTPSWRCSNDYMLFNTSNEMNLNRSMSIRKYYEGQNGFSQSKIRLIGIKPAPSVSVHFEPSFWFNSRQSVQSKNRKERT